MKLDQVIYSALGLLVYLTLAECQVGRQPEVYYANLGQNVVLPCKVGGGQFACYSSYTYQNREYAMAFINASRKYDVSGSSIGINNVKATDAGFYACSSDCRRMKIDQISYYLQPMCKLSLCLLSDLWVGYLSLADLGKINLTLTIQPHQKILFLGIYF